jgi:hypothetical protein
MTFSTFSATDAGARSPVLFMLVPLGRWGGRESDAERVRT